MQEQSNETIAVEEFCEVVGIARKNLESYLKKTNLSLICHNGESCLLKTDLAEIPQFKEMLNSTWDTDLKAKSQYSYASLEVFAGAGGMALGLEKAGFKHLYLNDMDVHACNTLKFNRPNWHVEQADIRNIDFKAYRGVVDLVAGGFPCQSFSYAGKELGFNDIRGTLFFEFARVLDEVRPKVFIAENVKGLLTHDEGKTLEVIKKVVDELGYKLIECNLYELKFYKIPQKRERLILVGVRKDLGYEGDFPRPSKFNRLTTLRDALYKGDLYPCDVVASKGAEYTDAKKQVMQLVPQGGNWQDLPGDVARLYMGKAFLAKGGKTGFARRLALNMPSLTIMCTPAQKQTDRCHPLHTRPLQVRESARIQTFPDDWEFTGGMDAQYKQIGNAVPVNFSHILGKSLIKLLNEISSDNM